MGNNRRPAAVTANGTTTLRTGRFARECPMQDLCYVNSVRTTKVSREFTRQRHVDVLKRSSVALAYRHGLPPEVTTPHEIIGSGTLIGPNLVLTSQHVLEDFKVYCKEKKIDFNTGNLRALFDYEYTAGTVDTANPQLAPPEQFPGISGTAYPGFIHVSCILEEGARECEDYALLVLEASVPDRSRVARISRRRLVAGEDVIALQHPAVTPRDLQARPNHTLIVTRVSGGPVQSVDATCDAFAFVMCRKGSSGGGVFDKDSGLVGVIHGTPPGGSHQGAYCWIAQMTDIVSKSAYLGQQFVQGQNSVLLSRAAACPP